MNPEEAVRQTVLAVVPDAEVHPIDLNGGGDHWFCVVVSNSFEGVRSFARQRPILAAFTPLIQTGQVHALDLKCVTPGELAEKYGGKLPTPFVPHQPGQGDHPGAW